MNAATISIVHEDSLKAGKQVALELIDELGGSPEVVLLFASAKMEQTKVLEGIYSVLPASTKLAGCSSYAEINSEQALTGSVTAMGIRAGFVSCETFKLNEGSTDSFTAGKEFGARLKVFDPSVLFLFPDGLKMNGTQFLLGLQDVLGRDFPIVGGMAADMGTFSQTFQYCNHEVITGGASALALKGTVEVVTVAKAGWMPVGLRRTVTKIDGSKAVLELDGRPALTLYMEYLGDRSNEMPGVGIEFPLGVVGGVIGSQRLPDDEPIKLIRAVIGVDESRKALLFVGDIPQGAEIAMTRASKDDLIHAADEAGAEVHQAMPDPSLAFFFDCMGRKLVLGARYKEELNKTIDRFGKVPKIGFYTYGELSPVGGVTMYHDETFTMVLLKVR